MKTTKLLLIIYVISFHTVFAQENIKKSYLELPKTEVIPIKDTKTNRQYELYVELPEGYSENNDTQYPVIYYTDAMWHVEILSGSAEYIMEEAILVGISWQKDIKEEFKKEGKVYVSRFRDYSVRKSSNAEHQAKYQFGQANNHLDFIRNDVIKYIENNYRAKPDNRTYFGYSLGGVFGAYTLLTQPDTFKNYILGSPALDGDIPTLSELKSHKSINANVFISYGSLEKELSKYAEEFITLLKSKNDKSLFLEQIVIEGSHQTAFPMTGVLSMQWLSQINSLYFGQKTPGTTAEIFAPSIVNTAENREVEGMFAADMKAFYFIKRPLGTESRSNVLTAVEYKNNQWQESVVKRGVSEPSISPDGNTIYFAKEYMERTNTGWSELKSIGEPFENIDIMRLSVSSNGTYYFDTFTPELDTPLRYSRLINGTYEQPKLLGKQFAIGKYNAHPFIAPDESYIIWDSRREAGYGSSDLYISFRADDGSWGPAINMGDTINTSDAENYPSVSPDGKYLFFDRRKKSEKNEPIVDIYWVSMEVIQALKPQ
ncbi:alpha/beta hydrolase-fold protein [Aquimarina sp. 2201CG5-10]|uniref:alpha/beta hydrolase-fold protein n=1 Tax=Aquimarina callyspongiae TaxID=3098150 RepID=UPI002AB5B252|nr:alpha/beta hydrolase-fold protein [Aquimarina sp. 2201CG5-10]MDY8136018.1 alpha/beta hydrolase-fold protein [Aquimarina sp. 2201CG5-10]